jgi:kinesin family protein C1
LESLTRLPPGGSGDDNLEESSMKTVKQQSRKESDAGPNNSSNDQEENAISSILIDGTGQERDTEEFSVLTDPNHGEHSKEMMNVIKGLDQKFELLDRRLSEFRPPQSVVEQSSNQITAEELEEKTTQIKDLSQTKSKLEKQNKNLGLELSSLKSDLSAERERLISIGAKLEQTKSLNESLKMDLNECKENYAYLNDKVIPRTERELQNSLEELKKRQKIINQTSSRFLEYETTMKKLKSEKERLLKETQEEKDHFQTLNKDSHQAQQEQQLENEKKDQIIKEIQQSLTLTKKELDDERSLNNENMIELQNVLLQLKNMMLEKEKLEKQFSDFKHEIVTKNKESNAAVRVVEEEKVLLQNRLKDVENKLKSVSEEKNNALIRLGTSDQREDELFHKLRESDFVRKELHARVMVLIGNIRVFVRVRPPLPNEVEASNAEQIFKFSSESGTFDEKKSSKYGCDDPTKNVLHVKEPFKDRGGLSQRRKKWSFGFDSVFDPSHSQEDLWEATEPLVQCAIDGFNVTLFAYGQTVSNLQNSFHCILV